MKSHEMDKQWSDRFSPYITPILGAFLIVPSSPEEDQKQAADFKVLTNGKKTIAARIRSPEYLSRYPHEFTIRSRRDSGSKTELVKIVAGLGDWFFYAHAREDGRGFALWYLIDLFAFREHYHWNKQVRSTEHPNGDGTHFVAFDIRTFVGEPALIIASSANASAPAPPTSPKSPLRPQQELDLFCPRERWQPPH